MNSHFYSWVFIEENEVTYSHKEVGTNIKAVLIINTPPQKTLATIQMSSNLYDKYTHCVQTMKYYSETKKKKDIWCYQYT